MKKIADLDIAMLSMQEDDDKDSEMPTRRKILRMIGNVKADTADDARRTRRLTVKIRDKGIPELILENDDWHFLLKCFEKNAMNLTAWMQGQILDVIESAEKVEPATV